MHRSLCILLTVFFWLPGGVVADGPSSALEPSPVPVLSSAGDAEQRLAQPDFPALAVAVSPDGERWATGGYQRVHIWNRQEGRLRHTWRVGDSWVRTLAFSPDGQVLAIGGDDGRVYLWDWEGGQPLQRLDGAGGTVYSVAFSSDGGQLASGAADHRIRLWSVATGQPDKTLQGHRAPVRGVAFSPDGTVLLSGAQDGAVIRWNMAELVPVARPFKGVRQGVHAVAFSPDGRWMAAGGYRAIHLWDGVTGQARSPLKKQASWVRSLAFNADSSQLLASADDGVLQLWQLDTGRVRESWSGHQSPVFAVASVRGQGWISAGGDGRILIWEEGSATPVWSLIGHGDGRWLSCRMAGLPHCWRGDDPAHLDRSPPATDADPVPQPAGMFWTEWASMGVVLITLLLAFGKRWALPLRIRGMERLSAVRRRLPTLGVPVRSPSPGRFAHLLGGERDLSVPNNRRLARICLPVDFPLAIREFFYVRLHPGQVLERIPLFSEYGVPQPAGADPMEGRPPLVVLVDADGPQTAMAQQLAHHADRLWVVADRGAVTRLLLAAQPRQAFAHLLADHLDPVLLSPYWSDGAVEKATLFFGRHTLLESLLRQERRNHLLIGGQGMGKTSLLQAVWRKLQQHPVLRPHLFVPEQADIGLPLARFLEYVDSSSLELLLDELARFPERKKPILLLDEADAFLLTDAARGFAVLERLSRFSAEGCCHLILAGSWDTHRLLQGAAPAPLAAWVDIHYLGPLESEAGWQLVRQPMAWLQREWESGVCLELMQASGGRPDWAMAFCHAVLGQLGVQEKTIAQHHLDAAWLSPLVRERLDHWSGLLSDGVEERRLDRLVVYASVGLDAFTPAELLGTLQKRYPTLLAVPGESKGEGRAAIRLQQVLDRLEMACLLRKAEDRYYYPSRLWRGHLLQQHPEERLKRALQGS